MSRSAIRQPARSSSPRPTSRAGSGFRTSGPGRYLVTVESAGFAKAAKTVTVEDAAASVQVAFALVPGSVEVGVTVTATRSERDVQLVPLRADGVSRETLQDKVAAVDRRRAAAGARRDAGRQRPDAGAAAAARPRLDARARAGGRRAAQQRAHGDRPHRHRGRPDRSQHASSAWRSSAAPGSVLYGTDALAGTVNIITNQPRFSDTRAVHLRARRLLQLERERPARHGDAGRHGQAVRAPVHRRRWRTSTTTAPARPARTRTPRRSSRAARSPAPTRSTTNFGFAFKAFPDPFNAPYVRSSATIPTSARERQQRQRERRWSRSRAPRRCR